MISAVCWPNYRSSVKTCCSLPPSPTRYIKALANKLLRNPASVEVVRRNTASEQIEQIVHFVDKKSKRERLSKMIGVNY